MNRILLAAGCLVTALTMSGASAGDVLQKAPAPTLRNPLEGDVQAQRAGAKLYARECAACHGSNREGRANVPPLNRREVFRAAPGALFWVLRNGELRRGMPSFAHLPEAQRWQIITFLQTGASH